MRTTQQLLDASAFVKHFCSSFNYNFDVEANSALDPVRKQITRPKLTTVNLEKELSIFVGLDEVKDQVRKLFQNVAFQKKTKCQ